MSNLVKDKINLSCNDLVNLFSRIENIVWEKSNRVAAALLGNKDEIITSEIINPKEQIKKIVEQMQIYFESMDMVIPGTAFRISLLLCSKNKFIDYYCFSPPKATPRTQATALNNSNSSAMIALQEKQINIVEDVISEGKNEKNKKKRYIITESTKVDGSGGIISYPIYDKELRTTVFVLNICCDKTHYFKRENKKLYVYILSKFCERILYEYRMSVLLEKVRKS